MGRGAGGGRGHKGAEGPLESQALQRGPASVGGWSARRWGLVRGDTLRGLIRDALLPVVLGVPEACGAESALVGWAGGGGATRLCFCPGKGPGRRRRGAPGRAGSPRCPRGHCCALLTATSAHRPSGREVGIRSQRGWSPHVPRALPRPCRLHARPSAGDRGGDSAAWTPAGRRAAWEQHQARKWPGLDDTSVP